MVPLYIRPVLDQFNSTPNLGNIEPYTHNSKAILTNSSFANMSSPSCSPLLREHLCLIGLGSTIVAHLHELAVESSSDLATLTKLVTMPEFSSAPPLAKQSQGFRCSFVRPLAPLSNRLPHFDFTGTCTPADSSSKPRSHTAHIVPSFCSSYALQCLRLPPPSGPGHPLPSQVLLPISLLPSEGRGHPNARIAPRSSKPPHCAQIPGQFDRFWHT